MLARTVSWCMDVSFPKWSVTVRVLHCIFAIAFHVFLTIALLIVVIMTKQAKDSIPIYANQVLLLGFFTPCNLGVKQLFVFELVIFFRWF